MLSLCKYKTYKFPLVGASLHHKGKTADLNLSAAQKQQLKERFRRIGFGSTSAAGLCREAGEIRNPYKAAQHTFPRSNRSEQTECSRLDSGNMPAHQSTLHS
jgi:hypothetical protein